MFTFNQPISPNYIQQQEITEMIAGLCVKWVQSKSRRNPIENVFQENWWIRCCNLPDPRLFCNKKEKKQTVEIFTENIIYYLVSFLSSHRQEPRNIKKCGKQYKVCEYFCEAF